MRTGVFNSHGWISDQVKSEDVVINVIASSAAHRQVEDLCVVHRVAAVDG